MTFNKQVVLLSDLLQSADITLNGPRTWDVQLHNPNVVQAILAKGSLGVGETFMAGDWDSSDLAVTLCRICAPICNLRFMPEVFGVT